MEIKKMYLDTTSKGRPGTKLGTVKAVACHYIGNPGSSAINNRNYFNNSGVAVSSHYIIGLAGEIIQCIPENEISYCTNSANSYTISIEACHPDSTGKFNDATYKAYVWLCADICKRHGLDPVNGGLIRHYDVTGKVCPKWFVDYPQAWETFKQDVKAAMAPAKEGWNETSDGRWRFMQNGKFVAGEWQEINGEYYYFSSEGYMHTGWLKKDGKWYYLRPDGKNHTGWLEHEKKWYYLFSDRGMHTGWLNLDKKWFYMDHSGVMQTGFTHIGDKDTGEPKWHIFNDGHLGNSSDKGAWMRTDSDGVLYIAEE